MLALLKIYFLFNLHFILTKCDPSHSFDELTVRKIDKKLIERKRQDTRDMCKMFNSEAVKANLLTEALPYNKYDKRKKELKLKEEREEELQNTKIHRVKRAVNSMNPALNVEDEQRVETIVDKIYDDLLEKGQKIAYRRKEMPKTEVINNSSAANKTARRFPFAPLRIERGPLNSNVSYEPEEGAAKPVRFVDGIVPYFIDARTYDTHLIDTITQAFTYFSKKTCIRLQRLRERPTDQKSLQNVIWLYITNPLGIRQCVHSNERAEIKGVQMIVFGYACMSIGDITHEIMHVLGFAHEHVRPDRDQHITILWDNIKPGYRKFFEVHKKSIVEGLPYDYDSVMHYPPKAFSKNGQVTILTKPDMKIGQREVLSEIDTEKIAMLYSNECNKRDREYLLKTCPSVGKSAASEPLNVPPKEIDDYFEDRLWRYGVIQYKLRDLLEFSSEEIDNIKEVIRHIENVTCVQFLDLTSTENVERDDVPSSADNKFNTDEIDRLVILATSGENETRAILPDTSSSYEEGTEIFMNDNIIIDPLKTVRKGGKVKNISVVKGKAANTDVKGKYANIGAKKKDANLGAKGKNASIGAKGRTANVTRKQSMIRRKRAVLPPPTRRHESNIVVLSRSALPGCACPRPGKPDGEYLVKINTDCFNSVNDLLHLFVHMLGLDHQHNMHDRDSYLHIVWDELTEDVKQEMKRKLPPAASVGFAYDYASVMHYPWLQIKNGKSNMMYPIWSDGWEMGQWQGLSSVDIQKINLLYFEQCVKRKQEEPEEGERNIEDTDESDDE